MSRAHEEVGRFIHKHRPDVVFSDVGMPYASSWDLLEVIRMSPALQSQPFVITTPDKRELEDPVGAAPAIECHIELRRVLEAVEAAAGGGR